MKHLHTLGVLIGTAKTRKTLCNKRVPESAMAQNGESADCAECRAQRDKEIAGHKMMLKYAADTGVSLAAGLAESIAALAADPYKNGEVLR